jgi:hypothetical protein
VKEVEVVEKPADGPSDAFLQDLHWASSSLQQSPLIRPLLAMARIGSTKRPLAIAVLRDALLAENKFVRAMALDELLEFGGKDLAEVGGSEMVLSLVRQARVEREELAVMAGALLERIAEHYPGSLSRDRKRGAWRFDPKGFPRGQDLPSLRVAGASAGSRTHPETSPRPGQTVLAPVPRAPESTGAEFGPEDGTARVDLIWAIDCSGSVQRSFKTMLETAGHVTRLLSTLLGNVRVGLVAYRDRVEVRMPLSEDIEPFYRALERLRADRGGDFPEGVDIAVRAALDESSMQRRPRSSVAVVVVGDDGPTAARAEALHRALRKLRREMPRLTVSCLKVESAFGGRRGDDFWDRLAEAGGGTALPLDAKGETLWKLCASITGASGVEPQFLRRILRLVARVGSRMQG